MVRLGTFTPQQEKKVNFQILCTLGIYGLCTYLYTLFNPQNNSILAYYSPVPNVLDLFSQYISIQIIEFLKRKIFVNKIFSKNINVKFKFKISFS